MTIPTLPNRNAPLDVLRGLAVAAMIIVCNPGSQFYVFPQLKNSMWAGCTMADLVFPFFLFIAGAAMLFSFNRKGNEFDKETLSKIGKRSLTLFLIGFAINAFPFFTINWSDLHIFGPLQRFALVYGLSACIALWLKKPQKILLAVVALILVHWGILAIFGDYSREGNIAGKIDIFLVGKRHLPEIIETPFDSYGILGTISGAATMLTGYLLGWFIANVRDKKILLQRAFGMGAIAIAVGLLWSDSLPLNKPLWTSSFALFSAGWATLALALCVYVGERNNMQKYLYPFRVLGANSLAIYVMSEIFTYTFSHVRTLSGYQLRTWIYNNTYMAVLGDNEWASLAYAIVFLALTYLFAIALYRQKIFLKV